MCNTSKVDDGTSNFSLSLPFRLCVSRWRPGRCVSFYLKPGRGQPCYLQEILTDLFKYLAIARRARGDLPGAKEALARVESLGGNKGREDVEGLDRLMAENKISIE